MAKMVILGQKIAIIPKTALYDLNTWEGLSHPVFKLVEFDQFRCNVKRGN